MLRKKARKHLITVMFTLIFYSVIGYGLFMLSNGTQQASFGVELIVTVLCLVGAYSVLKSVLENREQKKLKQWLR